MRVRRHSQTPGLVLLALVGASAAGAQPARETLLLRGGIAPPEGQVVGCSLEGVEVASPISGEVLIGWELVRSVGGEHADAAGAFSDVADKAWRALARLDRGDIPAAEPLLENLHVTYRDRIGPTAAAVHGGLLRCRLERGAHTLAVSAWLSWLHAGQATDARWFRPDASAGSVAGADPETGLLPDLPPIWIDLPAVRVFGDAPLAADALGDRERALAELYRHAARAVGGAQEPMPRLVSNDQGVALVWDIVASQSPVAQERAAGRKAIEARLRREAAGWQDAWLRVALGRSLLLEAEPDQRARGTIELLRVRVVHESDAPYLAGLALADAVVALRSRGDAAGAGLLRRELLDTFPGHPATGWEPILVWEGAATARNDQDDQTDLPGRNAGRVSRVESRKPHG